MAEDPVLYYRLEAVRESNRRGSNQLVTAACVSCIATGKILYHNGGPGYALSPEIVDALDRSKNEHKARVIIDADVVENAAALLERIVKNSQELVDEVGGPAGMRAMGLIDAAQVFEDAGRLVCQLRGE